MKEDVLDLKAYWRILIRNWWILVLGVTGGVLISWLTSSSAPPTYAATTKVFVQGGQNPGVPSGTDISTGRQLAELYADLIKTRPVAEEVVTELSLPYSPETLVGKIDVRSPRSLIEITARDTSPQSSAEIANTVARVFIRQYRDQQVTQIAQFQSALSQYGIASDTRNTVLAQAAALTVFNVVEEAIPPSTPLGQSNNRRLIIGGVLGLLVAGALMMVREHLDDKVRTPEDLKRVANLLTLGTVFRRTGLKGRVESPISIIDMGEHDNFAEWYRFLRANLEFASLEMERFKRLLLTSAKPLEGKTTTAINLSISFASKGASVILVDTDLRRPEIHRAFKVENKIGLTGLLVGGASLDEALSPTSIDGLRILTSGPLPSDPTRILQPSIVEETLSLLDDNADIVIYDSPPVLLVADTLLLASMVDGVVLVVDSSQTSEDAVRRSVESLKQTSATLLGGVLNKVAPRGRSDYYYYYYDSYNYYSRQDSDDGGPTNRSTHSTNGRAASFRRKAGSVLTSPINRLRKLR